MCSQVHDLCDSGVWYLTYYETFGRLIYGWDIATSTQVIQMVDSAVLGARNLQ